MSGVEQEDATRSERQSAGGDRAVSTVLDVGLAIVLIAAAAYVLTTTPAEPTADVGSDDADESAELLGSTTTVINYSLSPVTRDADDSLVAFERTAGPKFERTAHGTLADLSADAALGNISIDGQAVTSAGDDFEQSLAAAIRRSAAGRGYELQVQAVWRPYPGAPVAGNYTAGPTPPPGAQVHAAQITVPSGVPPVRSRALASADGGYSAVARVIADAAVRALFPHERTDLALELDHPTAQVTAYRYRRTARLLGADLDGTVSLGGGTSRSRAANQRLAAALADRLTADLRDEYPTPAAAARNTTVGEVVVVARTWSG